MKKSIWVVLALLIKTPSDEPAFVGFTTLRLQDRWQFYIGGAGGTIFYRSFLWLFLELCGVELELVELEEYFGQLQTSILRYVAFQRREQTTRIVLSTLPKTCVVLALLSAGKFFFIALRHSI